MSGSPSFPLAVVALSVVLTGRPEGLRYDVPDVGMSVRASAQQGVRADPTGNIRGSIEIRRSVATTERRPSVSDLGMPSRRDRPDRMESVIYLENAPAGAFEQRPTGRARMTQRNETFLPTLAGGPRRNDGRFPERGPDLPQRLLALEGQAVRPGALRGGKVQAGTIRSAWYRARLLRHPFSYERVHPGVQSSVLRYDERRRSVHTFLPSLRASTR